MKTSELIDMKLDWAVCKAAGMFNAYPMTGKSFSHIWKTHKQTDGHLHPSTDWAQGGPIIEREGFSIEQFKDRQNDWRCFDFRFGHVYAGNTMLIAAMRCFVASKLGDEVELPEELTK